MKKLLWILLYFATLSCNKFLDEKPDKKLVIPSTLADLQAIIDNVNTLVANDPYADELSADNFYIPAATWQTLADYDRGYYTWQKDNAYLSAANDWSNLYKKVYCANTVLENLEHIERTAGNKVEWDNLKGQAFMIRGKGFLQAVLQWSLAYDAATANTDMGIPLRLNTDFAEVSTKPSVQQTYDRIVADLNACIPLLPNRGMAVSRSSKAAAYALLARTYLTMHQYAKAGLYADSSLQINSALLNYNSLSTTAAYSIPIPATNPEVNFYTGTFTSGLSNTNAKVDSVLYNTYHVNDHRRSILFRANTDGSMAFKGSYVGANGQFTGISTNEMYLTRAECFARTGNITAAMTDVNTLLKMRYKTGLFTPLTAATGTEALDIILKERRKELLHRGLRWMDIKRLNKEGASITQKRIINNIVYVLPPNDLRYALPIPDYVIHLSGIPQNPR